LQIGENYHHIKRPLFVLLNDNENTRNNFVNVIISGKIKDTILKLIEFFLNFHYSNIILFIIIQNQLLIKIQKSFSLSEFLS